MKTRVKSLLLADGRDGVAFVIVRGVDQQLVGKLEQASEQRLVLRPRIAVLQVCAAGSPDQQRVAGEHAVGHEVAVGIVGMPRRIQRLEGESFDTDLVAVAHPDGNDIGLALFAHHRDAARALTQRFKSGDVVGVEMGVDRLHQPEIELLQKLDVAVDPFEHRVDDERFSAMAAREKIGVGAGGRVEQLPEDHDESLIA